VIQIRPCLRCRNALGSSNRDVFCGPCKKLVAKEMIGKAKAGAYKHEYGALPFKREAGK
jgi:hypothetical protein